jgi:hypothetical protein
LSPKGLKINDGFGAYETSRENDFMNIDSRVSKTLMSFHNDSIYSPVRSPSINELPPTIIEKPLYMSKKYQLMSKNILSYVKEEFDEPVQRIY